MNNKLVNVTQDELDLCAEGELSTDEREDLFRRLDEHPEQWRFCALAALETLALRATVTSDENVIHPQPVSVTPPAKSQPSLQFVGWITAACCVVALGAGATIGHRLASSSVAENRVEQPQTKAADGAALAGGAQRDEILSILDRLNIEDEELLAVVQVNRTDGVQLVPVVSCPSMANELLRESAKPIPPHQIKLANRNGYHVSRQTQMLAIERPSERTQIVPLQTVRYQFVGSTPL